MVRLVYMDRPTGKWFRIAANINSMINSDGIPHLPKLGRALSSLYVETYWACEDAIFHPHNEFVFKLNLSN